jgi:hypothetical protein
LAKTVEELSNLWDIGLGANNVFMGTVKFPTVMQFGENVFSCWIGVSLKKGPAIVVPSCGGLSCIAVAWKDESSSLIPLKGEKNSHPLQIADYAVFQVTENIVGNSTLLLLGG